MTEHLQPYIVIYVEKNPDQDYRATIEALWKVPGMHSVRGMDLDYWELHLWPDTHRYVGDTAVVIATVPEAAIRQIIDRTIRVED